MFPYESQQKHDIGLVQCFEHSNSTDWVFSGNRTLIVKANCSQVQMSKHVESVIEDISWKARMDLSARGNTKTQGQ